MHKRTGFTLIEVLVALSIVAVLAALMVPLFVSATPNKQNRNPDDYYFATTIEYSGCEYVIFNQYQTNQSVVHKGNCKGCFPRKLTPERESR